MDEVSFTQMKDGTEQDYLLLRALEARYLEGTARRVLRELERQGEEHYEGYKVSRLEHALQAATRALRAGADDDWVVSALLHDIGDGLAPQNHDRLAAEILRPFVREECTWVVGHHGEFQMYYYAHHYGWDRLARDKHRGQPHYETCKAFCEHWDQSSFDPGYPAEPLELFVPVLERVFARKPYAPDVLRTGYCTPVARFTAVAAPTGQPTG